jgi:methylated-DNA-protein-cysteine methyltransferase-like protein
VALADFKSVDVAAPPGQVGSIPTRFRHIHTMRKTRGVVTPGTFERIYAVVSRIPHGRVATYGQVARLADLPGRARLVGYALNALDGRRRIPWHRVINAQGRISARTGDEDWGIVQRLRLQREKVVFGPGGTISLARFRWRPRGPRIA